MFPQRCWSPDPRGAERTHAPSADARNKPVFRLTGRRALLWRGEETRRGAQHNSPRPFSVPQTRRELHCFGGELPLRAVWGTRQSPMAVAAPSDKDAAGRCGRGSRSCWGLGVAAPPHARDACSPPRAVLAQVCSGTSSAIFVLACWSSSVRSTRRAVAQAAVFAPGSGSLPGTLAGMATVHGHCGHGLTCVASACGLRVFTAPHPHSVLRRRRGSV